MDNYSTVFNTSNLAVAEVLKSLLQANGIDAAVFSDDCGGMRPALAFSLGVSIKVKNEDLEKAKKIITDFEKGNIAG